MLTWLTGAASHHEILYYFNTRFANASAVLAYLMMPLDFHAASASAAWGLIQILDQGAGRPCKAAVAHVTVMLAWSMLLLRKPLKLAKWPRRRWVSCSKVGPASSHP